MRDRSKFNSEFTRFIQDSFLRVFTLLDVDAALWERATKTLRLIEWKHPRQKELEESQKEVLPIFAALIDLGIKSGLLSPDSGVYALWMDIPPEGEKPDWDSLSSKWLKLSPEGERYECFALKGDALRRFLGFEAAQ